MQTCTISDPYLPKISFPHHSALLYYFFLFFILYLFLISNHFYLISVLLTLLTLSPLLNFLNFLHLLIPLILLFLSQYLHLHLSTGYSLLLIFSFSMDLFMFLIPQTSDSRCLDRNMITSCQDISVRLKLWDWSAVSSIGQGSMGTCKTISSSVLLACTWSLSSTSPTVPSNNSSFYLIHGNQSPWTS